MNKRPKERK